MTKKNAQEELMNNWRTYLIMLLTGGGLIMGQPQVSEKIILHDKDIEVLKEEVDTLSELPIKVNTISVEQKNMAKSIDEQGEDIKQIKEILNKIAEKLK